MPEPGTRPPDPLRDELGPAVEVLARVSRILERASGGLSLSHYRVLALVAAGDGRASRLAERLALGKPAISAAVESLTARGLLVRSSSEPDRRATRLEMTPLGRSELGAAEAAMSARLVELLDHTTDRPAVLAALRSLSQALDRRQAERDAGSESTQAPRR